MSIGAMSVGYTIRWEALILDVGLYERSSGIDPLPKDHGFCCSGAKRGREVRGVSIRATAW